MDPLGTSAITNLLLLLLLFYLLNAKTSLTVVFCNKLLNCCPHLKPSEGYCDFDILFFVSVGVSPLGKFVISLPPTFAFASFTETFRSTKSTEKINFKTKLNHTCVSILKQENLNLIFAQCSFLKLN